MKTFSCIALATLAWAAPSRSPSEAIGKVSYSPPRSLRARSDGFVDWEALLSEIKHTILKYDPHAQIPPVVLTPHGSVKRAIKGVVPLFDSTYGTADVEYVGTGRFGKKSQPFTLDFDTGSSDVWIPGRGCNGCVGTNRYDNGGMNLKNQTTIEYGSGEVEGENWVDSLTIGGYTVPQQTFIAVKNATGFSNTAAAGIVGLAFPSIAQTKATPFFFNLLSEGQLPESKFSFYLGRLQSNTGGSSELFIGGADSSRYTGSFTQIPVISQTYWEVAIGGVTVNEGRNLQKRPASAALDTGTTLALVPFATAAQIYKNIPGAQLYGTSSTENIYTLPCDTNATVAFELGGQSFAVNQLDLSVGMLSSNTCVGAIIGAQIVTTPNFSILGDTFLKNWYSSFSYSPQTKKAFVSLAKAV